MPRHVHLEYAHSVDTRDWQERHMRGEVPDRLPYGLDRMRAHGLELHARPAAKSRVAAVVAGGVARRASGGFELLDAVRNRARRSCDVSLCWDERTGVPAAMRSGLRGEPPVVTGAIWLTEPDAVLPGLRRSVVREALRRAHAVWALSTAQLDVLRHDWGVDPARLHYLPFGIAADFWRPNGHQAEPDVIVSAGNDRHRDHALLVEAVARLRRRRPGVRLELVTHQPVDVPRELGVRVASESHAALRDRLRRAAVVAVALRPNLHVSGMSVLLEAMACARPVVASATAGMDGYVRDGAWGLTVPPGDADAMANALESLLADADRARALGAAGRVAVERAHSTELQAAGLAELVHEALA